jgi:hypothetical protein
VYLPDGQSWHLSKNTFSLNFPTAHFTQKASAALVAADVGISPSLHTKLSPWQFVFAGPLENLPAGQPKHIETSVSSLFGVVENRPGPQNTHRSPSAVNVVPWPSGHREDATNGNANSKSRTLESAIRRSRQLRVRTLDWTALLLLWPICPALLLLQHLGSPLAYKPWWKAEISLRVFRATFARLL